MTEMTKFSNKVDKHRVSREMFDEWQENPSTQLLKAHLEDFRATVAEGHSHAIENGVVPDHDQQIFDAGKCTMLSDIAQITFDDIESFYREDEEDEDDDEDGDSGTSSDG